jgi:hypothetical protein
MNIALRVVQGWLAAVFLIAGGVKLAQPKETLGGRRGMGYAADRSATELKLLGLAEVLGAVGRSAWPRSPPEGLAAWGRTLHHRAGLAGAPSDGPTGGL